MGSPTHRRNPLTSVPDGTGALSADPDGLWQLVYTSAAVREFGRDELREMLRGGRRRNAARGVTGMLVYHDGQFMQALEGRRQVVEDLFDKICRDPRHRGVFVLLRGAITDREFADHTMAFVHPEGQAPDGFDTLLHDARHTYPRTPATRARRLLATFADTQLRRYRHG